MKKFAIALWMICVAGFAVAADPALKFALDNAGLAQIVPDLPKGTPYDFHPYAAADGTVLLGMTWVDNGRAKLAFYALPLKYEGNPTPIVPPVIPPVVPPIVPPVVPPVAEKANTAIIVYEGVPKNLPAAGGTLATLCAGAGGGFYSYPVESVQDKNTADLDLRWIGKAAGKELPYVFLATKDGKVMKEGKYVSEAATAAELKTLLGPGAKK